MRGPIGGHNFVQDMDIDSDSDPEILILPNPVRTRDPERNKISAGQASKSDTSVDRYSFSKTEKTSEFSF